MSPNNQLGINKLSTRGCGGRALDAKCTVGDVQRHGNVGHISILADPFL